MLCLSEPEDSLLGATDPCAGRSEILGQAAPMNAGNSRSGVQRQRASASGHVLKHSRRGVCGFDPAAGARIPRWETGDFNRTSISSAR
jgi:hypothetical protein